MKETPPWLTARAKRDGQLQLRSTYRVVVVGRGPTAVGWPVGPREWVRCTVCSYLLQLDGTTTDRCWCGALASDAGAARVGSELGDEAIERVRLEPRH